MKFIIIILTVLFLVALSDAQRRRGGRGRGKGRRDQCHLREMESCLEKMQSLGKGPDPTGLIATAAGLEKICKTIKEDVIKCVKGFVKKCGTPLHREVSDLLVDQVLLRVKKFCDDPKEKSTFLKHSPCMHEKVFSTNEYKSTCNNNFLATIDGVEAKTSNADGAHETLCCGFNTWEECTTGLIKKSCGDAGEKSITQFLGKSFGTLTGMFCPKDLFVPSSDACKKLKVAAGAKASGKVGENAITKYVTSLFSFLFITN